jgi:alpha-L-fucosidase 2
VQGYDGTLRIAPAVPPGWNFDGSVFVCGGTKVDVQVRNGAVITVGLEVPHAQTILLRNPWPGSSLRVVDARTGRSVSLTSQQSAEDIAFHAIAGHTYLIERTEQPALPFAAIDGIPATTYRRLNTVQVGLPPR